MVGHLPAPGCPPPPTASLHGGAAARSLQWPACMPGSPLLVGVWVFVLLLQWGCSATHRMGCDRTGPACHLARVYAALACAPGRGSVLGVFGASFVPLNLSPPRGTVGDVLGSSVAPYQQVVCAAAAVRQVVVWTCGYATDAAFRVPCGGVGVSA